MRIWQVKLVVVVFAVLNVWLLWHVPTIANAVLLFCVGGAVPGTHIFLSPNGVYIVCGVLFALLLVAVFGRGVVRLFRSPHADIMPLDNIRTPDVKSPVVVRCHQDVPKLLPAVRAPAPKKPKTYRLQTAIHMLFVGLTIGYVYSAVTAILAAHKLARLAGRFAKASRPYVIQLCAWLIIIGKKIGRSLENLALFIWRTVVLLALLLQVAWQQTEPQLRRFDAWIGSRLHGNTFSHELLKMAHEYADVVGTFGSKLMETSKATALAVRDAWRNSATRK
jgi:hypothetical protein